MADNNNQGFLANAAKPLGSSNFWADFAHDGGRTAILHWLSQKNIDLSSKGELVYAAPALYTNYWTHVLTKRLALTASQQLSLVFAKAQAHLRQKEREKIHEQYSAINQKIIDAGNNVHEGYDKITLDGGHEVIAKDCYNSNKVDGALFLSYLGKEQVEYKQQTLTDNQPSPIMSKTVYFCDIVPKITAKSGKNLVCTTVQGRDFTRKELIGGDDIIFTVSGEINSNLPGVYPADQVKKFINIMRYNGIVSVHNVIFGQFNVKNIIIKDYSLPHSEYTNIQPYSFTCVAVEPDEVVVTQDTISYMDYAITVDEKSGWQKLVLGDKDLGAWSQLASSALEGAANMLEVAGSMGIGSLLDAADSWFGPKA